MFQTPASYVPARPAHHMFNNTPGVHTRFDELSAIRNATDQLSFISADRYVSLHYLCIYIHANALAHTRRRSLANLRSLSRAHPLTYSLAQILSLVPSRAISIEARDLRGFNRARL